MKLLIIHIALNDDINLILLLCQFLIGLAMEICLKE